MLCVFVGIMAIFYAATFPMYGACAGDYFPKELMGTAIGAWTPFYGLGAVLAHWVTGILRDKMGCYDHSFLINAVMASLAIVLILVVREKRKRELEC